MNQSNGTPPRRLRRLPTVWLGDGFPRYFLTVCVADRLPILANAQTHERLVQFLADSPPRYDWWPTRYVMMPDHLHLLVIQGDSPRHDTPPITLGAWIKALKALVSQREFRWQTGFFDHVLRSDESETEKWEYIRQNPVRAGLVTKAENWPYSGEM